MIRLFRHFIPLSLLLLAGLEFLLFLEIAEFSAENYFQGHGAHDAYGAGYRPWLFAAVLTLMNSVFGLYEWGWTRGPLAMTSRVLGSLAVTTLLYAGASRFLTDPFLIRSGMVAAIAMSGLTSLLIRLLFMEFGKTDMFKRRVLVVGAGTRAAALDDIIAAGEDKGILVVGYLPMGSPHRYVAEDRVIDEEGSIYEIARRLRVEEIVVAIRQRRQGGMPSAELLECKLRGIPVSEMANFCERQTGLIPLGSLNTSWIIFADGFAPGSLRDSIKRLFDLLVSGLFLLATGPVMLLFFVLIKLESRGPALYTQVRVGQNDEPFTIYKFRSMRTDAEKDGVPIWARKNDNRITRVGAFIRRTRIDELPQILNVFLGHMSFVGPRPERPYFVDELASQIPFYRARHSVKPGITGWAQVKFPYGASVEDAMHKLEYDLYYVKNHSLFLDFSILLQTVQVVVLGKGVR
ncbi:MAG: TIGR03013 family PEP-CTERM/XrtA system glycosyltransferase [Betaproteobacteria bacterium]|nr:TIGR03013 family PEP-CTERM/XrtA system glycosyltransferase [Betaproteobacteria bacterium]